MAIDANTRLYCIIGNPVSHSMSPAIHNAAFEKEGINAAYVAFHVGDLDDAVRGMRALGISGASVTIPHKVSIIPLLDRIDEVARMIGAVNTVVREGDDLVGHNTDGPGAARALKDAGIMLSARSVAMIGSGGAARAIAFTLAARENIASLAILSVIAPELNKLVDEIRKSAGMKVEGHLLESPGSGETPLRRALDGADILINASPVGMHPDNDKTPVPSSMLRPDLCVFDAVYNPLETRLIKESKSIGAKTISGVEMFINQGALQFEMWTGKKAPIALMRKIVMEKLGNKH